MITITLGGSRGKWSYMGAFLMMAQMQEDSSIYKALAWRSNTQPLLLIVTDDNLEAPSVEVRFPLFGRLYPTLPPSMASIPARPRCHTTHTRPHASTSAYQRTVLPPPPAIRRTIIPLKGGEIVWVGEWRMPKWGR